MSHQDSLLIPQHPAAEKFFIFNSSCRCCFIFAGVIYGFKGLILVFGLFLAYETRSIKVKQINDSRYVAMSIYNIAVLCLITAPVAMVIVSILDRIFHVQCLSIYRITGLATGCIVRFCITRRNLLLFSQHAADICAKSKYGVRLCWWKSVCNPILLIGKFYRKTTAGSRVNKLLFVRMNA